MSIGRVSAGNGYEYLTRSVRSDAHDYYVGAGEAPGRWTGGGLGRLGLAGEVAESEMALLYGAAAHPHTGEILSTPYRTYRSIEERIASKLAVLGPAATVEDRARVRAEQYRIGDRAPVAGFDCTFSPAKSVSTLWALAPPEQRVVIEAAHDAAIDAAFGWLEQRALHTRAGRDGVRHLDAEGFIVARFRHRTSRNGDPQLHTHCAVANRVWSTSENRWRTLDGQGLYRERAGADAVYMAALEHELTARLGVSFEERGDVREVASVPERLVQRWSSRRAQILDGYDARASQLGRAATSKERSEVLRTVTLATRRDKVRDGHIGLHQRWGDEAAVLGVDWVTVSAPVAVERVVVDRVATSCRALDALEVQRANWSYSHLTAELARAAGQALTPGELRDLAEATLRDGRVVALSIGEIGDQAPLRRANGDSVYRDPQRERFSTVAVTGAETYLAETATIADGPVLSRAIVKAQLARMDLGVDQAAAVEQILCGGERITVLIGPAGSGKTHTQRAVVDLARRHGRDVFGLALSQNAADVLAAEAGCRTENIARARARGYDAEFPTGGIVIVDEAAMAGTLDLAWVAERAHAARCTVVFVGDDRQLQSPSAGGIIRRLADNRHTVWLSDVRRFSAEWEGPASIGLRVGDAGVTAVYEDHDRLRGGGRDEMLAAVVADWCDDQAAGRNTVMIARDNDTVAELSGTARAVRVAAGDVEAAGVRLRDGTRAGVGDRIVTRLNNQQLRTEHDREVVNRAGWRVTERHPNGALTAISERFGDRVFLPPSYVAEHVELAYAATIAGVQGRTLDGGRVLFDERSGRDELYVAMTRGRHFNIGYAILDTVSDTDDRRAARSAGALFARVIGNDNGETSAMDLFAAELALIDSTIRLDAIRDDWTTVITDHLRGDATVVVGDVVRVVDRDHIGTVTDVDPDATTAVVRFASRQGRTALIPLPVDQLTVIQPTRPQLTRDALHAQASHDPWLATLLDYLTRVDTARTERAAQLANEAAGTVWAQLVPAQQLPAVAYYRDRWQIDDPFDPLGAEPQAQRSRHHRDWEHLTKQIGPAGTLHQLAQLRDRNTDPTQAALIDQAMTRRRNTVINAAIGGDRPPQWAAPIIRREAWSNRPAQAARERDIVAKIAVYRDRYNITSRGYGDQPTETDQRRIWQTLRTQTATLHTDQRHDDHHHHTERSHGYER